jgi:hypothetical protein
VSDALYPGLVGDWLWRWNTCQDTSSYPYPEDAIGGTEWTSGIFGGNHHYINNIFANEYFRVTDGDTPSISCGYLYDIQKEGEAGAQD